MDTHGREQDPEEGRVRRLYDRLAELFRGLSPSRQQALQDWLDEQEEEEGKAG